MIFSQSAFYFDIAVTDLDNIVSFSEGGGDEFFATLKTGRYTLTTYLNEVLRALNAEGDLIYSGSVDREGRIYTIQASGDFELLVASASVDQLAFPKMGFTGADRTGGDSYTGTGSVGKVYRPQFRLQNYVAFDDNQKAVDSTVNVSANGQVELIRFGRYKIMECDLMFITDIDQGVGQYVRTVSDGVSQARTFMEYCCTKGPMEFIPDVTTPGDFRSCILETTVESRDGVDFKLKEQYARGLAGYYSTGLLTFREVIP